jgi:hypothetical protein
MQFSRRTIEIAVISTNLATRSNQAAFDCVVEVLHTNPRVRFLTVFKMTWVVDRNDKPPGSDARHYYEYKSVLLSHGIDMGILWAGDVIREESPGLKILSPYRALGRLSGHT